MKGSDHIRMFAASVRGPRNTREAKVNQDSCLRARGLFGVAGLLALHGRGAVEARLHRIDGDVRPALGVHELLPALVEETLVVLRDVALLDEPRVVRSDR